MSGVVMRRKWGRRSSLPVAWLTANPDGEAAVIWLVARRALAGAPPARRLAAPMVLWLVNPAVSRLQVYAHPFERPYHSPRPIPRNPAPRRHRAWRAPLARRARRGP